MLIGADLVTFFNPSFWGVRSESEVSVLAAEKAPFFWRKILNTLAAAGITGLELTFPPFSWQNAAQAFGSAEALQHELEKHNLAVWSCFFPDLDRIPVAEYSASAFAILASVSETARFISSTGGRVMVAGLPCRDNWLATPPQFTDLAFASPIAGLLNRMGEAAAREGVAMALHTEAQSIFCAPANVDLFMLLTDPRYVHLCPDPAHITLEGGNPVRLVARHLERVIVAHWKDASGVMPVDTVIDETIHAQHRPYFREPGKGSVSFTELSALLAQAPLRCGPVLELDACPDPLSALSRGATFVRTLCGHTTS